MCEADTTISFPPHLADDRLVKNAYPRMTRIPDPSSGDLIEKSKVMRSISSVLSPNLFSSLPAKKSTTIG